METPLSICFDGAIGCPCEPIVRVVKGECSEKTTCLGSNYSDWNHERLGGDAICAHQL